MNFIDVYHREGRYPVALPFVIGQEGAGVVSAVGAEVKSVKAGDRVAWTGIMGSYAEYVAVPADRLVKIPQGVSEREAAAAMLQGMTAHYLAYTTFPLKRGDTALVHAAAGGVGLLLVQTGAQHRGACDRHGLDRGKGQDWRGKPARTKSFFIRRLILKVKPNG